MEEHSRKSLSDILLKAGLVHKLVQAAWDHVLNTPMNWDTTSVGDCIEGFAEAKINNNKTCIAFPSTEPVSYFSIEGSRVGQAQFVPAKSILLVSSQHLVLCVTGNGFQKESCCELPENTSEGWVVWSSPSFSHSF